MVKLDTVEFDSPLGPLRAVLRASRVCDLDPICIWPSKQARLGRRFGRFELRTAGHAGRELQTRLRAYFAGDLVAIDRIEVDPGGTGFQQRMWHALRAIPAGLTESYGVFARHLGNPRAARAVGAANGQNPVAVIIPCHRLIGADGSLTGYASGLANKCWLLRHEGARDHSAPQQRRKPRRDEHQGDQPLPSS